MKGRPAALGYYCPTGGPHGGHKLMLHLERGEERWWCEECQEQFRHEEIVPPRTLSLPGGEA